MKKNTLKKNSQPDYEAEIRNAIMATDTILHLDWQERLALYLEERVREEAELECARQAFWYRTAMVFILALFIGWYCMYGKCKHPRLDEIKAQYEQRM